MSEQELFGAKVKADEKKLLSINFDMWVYNEVQRISEEHDMSKNEVVRRIMQDYFMRESKP